MGTRRHGRSFRERSRPPLLVVLLGLAASVSITFALPVGYESVWHQTATAVLPVAFLAGFTVLIVVEVRDGEVRWARRAGGVRISPERLVAVRVLHGRALREVRRRLTPSLRLHCPVWERVGVQLVATDDEGRRVEHLVAVRDLSGFLRALEPGPVEEVADPPVPV